MNDISYKIAYYQYVHSANPVQYFIAFVHYFLEATSMNFASTKTKKLWKAQEQQ
jgi:hypothetical protein